MNLFWSVYGWFFRVRWLVEYESAPGITERYFFTSRRYAVEQFPYIKPVPVRR